MKNLQAIIFDMDGVIVDSEALSVASERKTLAGHGIVVEEGDWDTFKGKTTVAIFDYILKKYGIKHLSPQKMREEKMSHYMNLFEGNISLFDGFTDLIEYLRKKYRIALVTSSGRDVQEKVFNTFGLHPHFDLIVTGDMVSHGKPHPEPYLLALEKLGLRGEDCVVIEDSDNGVNSAQAAGIKTIAVTHTFPKEKIAHADFVVKNLREIMDLV